MPRVGLLDWRLGGLQGPGGRGWHFSWDKVHAEEGKEHHSAPQRRPSGPHHTASQLGAERQLLFKDGGWSGLEARQVMGVGL